MLFVCSALFRNSLSSSLRATSPFDRTKPDPFLHTDPLPTDLVWGGSLSNENTSGDAQLVPTSVLLVARPGAPLLLVASALVYRSLPLVFGIFFATLLVAFALQERRFAGDGSDGTGGSTTRGDPGARTLMCGWRMWSIQNAIFEVEGLRFESRGHTCYYVV